MANSSYMPSRKADQVAWAATLVENVGPKTAEYGVPDALMTQFTTINTQLQAAWETAQNPTTRTKGTVAAADTALRAMRAMAAFVVSAIYATPSVTDQMKIDAGVTVRSSSRTPVPVPTTSPFIQVMKVEGRTVTIELRQSQAKRGKPAKVAGATVFTHVGPSAPVENDEWKFAANTTRTTLVIPFGPSSTGDTVWITAFWSNNRDESGPAAAPVSVNLPAGGALPGEVDEPSMKVAA